MMLRRSTSRRAKALMAASVAVVLTCVVGCGSSSKSSSSPSTGTGGSSSGAAATGSPIKIGNIGSYTGATATSNAPVRDALIAWSKTVNAAGGINGHPVEIVVQDDKNDPAASAQALRTLVESDHVVAIAGVAAQGTDSTWDSYTKANNIPIVGGLQGAGTWYTNPMYFPLSSGTNIKAAAYLLGPKNGGASKIFSFYCAEVSSCATTANQEKAIASKLGVDFLGSVSVSATSANYAAVCLQAKNAGANGVANTLPQSSFLRVVQTCAQQGFTPIYSLNQGAITDEALALPQLEKSFVYRNAFPPDADAAAAFRTAMGKYAPDVNLANSQAQAGWAAGILLQTALKNISKTANITSADVVNGLNSVTNDTLGGLLPQPVTFKAGAPHEPQTCLFTAHIINKKLVSDKDPLCSDVS